MPLVIATQGLLELLNVKRPLQNTWVCRLFQNNIVPVAGTQIAAFQQATFQGYVAKAINFANFPAIQPNGKALMTSQLITWTPTGVAVQNTIFGYYVTDAANTVLYYSERNPAGGIIVGQDLSPFTVQLNFTEATDPT